MARFLTRLGVWFLILVLILAALVFVAVPLIPLSSFKPQINQQLTQALGRQVNLNGPIRLQAIPRLAARVSDVSLDNIDGGLDPLMASMEALEFKASFLPLLRGQIEVEAIILKAPKILLEVTPDGRPNWVFETVDQTAQTEASPSNASSGPGLSDLTVNDFQIEEGSLVYLDRRTGFKQTIEGLTTRAALIADEQNLNAQGSLVWQGLPLNYAMDLRPVEAALSGGNMTVSLDVDADEALKASVSGQVQISPNLTFQGPVSVSTNTLPSLAEKAGVTITAADQLLGPMSLAGDLVVVGDAFAFSNARASVDLPAVSAQFVGQTGYQQSLPNVAGNFNLDVKQAAPIVDAIRAFVPQVLPLSGTAKAYGQVMLVGSDFDLTGAAASANLDVGSMSFAGEARKRGDYLQTVADMSVAIDELAPLTALAEPFVPAISTVTGSLNSQAKVSVDGDTYQISNALIDARTNLGVFGFSGEASAAGEDLSARGTLDLDLPDLSKVASLAAEFIPEAYQSQLASVTGRASANAALVAQGNQYQLSGAAIDLRSNLGTIRFDGDAATDGTLYKTNGLFDVSIPDIAPLADFAKAYAPQVGSVTGLASAKGQIEASNASFSLTGADVQANTNLARVNFQGDISQGSEAVSAQGSYAIRADDLASLVALSPVSLPGLEGLAGFATASGQLNAVGNRIQSDNTQIQASTTFGAVNAQGSAWFDEAVGVDMVLAAEIPSVDRVTRAFAPTLQTGMPDSQVTFQGRLQTDLTNTKISQAQLGLANSLVSASFSGDARIEGSEASITGALAAQGRSLRKLAENFNVALPGEPSVYGPFVLRSNVEQRDLLIQLDEASLQLDELALSLAASLDLSGAKPLFQADLTMPPVALDPYIKTEATTKPVAQANGNSWHQSPIDWSGLKMANARISLTSGGLTAYGFELDQATINANLQDGRLEASIPSLQAYQGAGSGKLVLNARSAEPSFSAQFAMNNVAIQPLFQAISGRTELQGTGNLNVDLLSWGVSQSRLMSNLQGSARLDMVDGAITGFDLPATITSLKARQLSPAVGSQYQTQFSSVNSTATIQGGVLTTQGFGLQSPSVRLEGKGSVDLGRRQMNYRLEPQLTQDFTQSRGLDGALSKLTIPVALTGPWDNLTIKPDLSGFLDLALSNPQSLLNLLPGDLASDVLPDDFDLAGTAAEQREASQRLIQEQAAAAEAEARRIADAAATRAREEADRLRALAQERALQEAARLEEIARQRLEDAQSQVQDSIGGLIDNGLGQDVLGNGSGLNDALNDVVNDSVGGFLDGLFN